MSQRHTWWVFCCSAELFLQSNWLNQTVVMQACNFDLELQAESDCWCSSFTDVNVTLLDNQKELLHHMCSSKRGTFVNRTDGYVVLISRMGCWLLVWPLGLDRSPSVRHMKQLGCVCNNNSFSAEVSSTLIGQCSQKAMWAGLMLLQAVWGFLPYLLLLSIHSESLMLWHFHSHCCSPAEYCQLRAF